MPANITTAIQLPSSLTPAGVPAGRRCRAISIRMATPEVTPKATFHRTVLSALMRASSAISPGRANMIDTADARRYWSRFSIHSRNRAWATNIHRPNTVKAMVEKVP